MESQDSGTPTVIRSASLVTTAIITIAGSIFASAFAVAEIIYKGNLGYSIGLEFLPCLGAPIPGLIACFIARSIRKDETAPGSIKSAIIGIAVASVTMVSFYAVIIMSSTHEEHNAEKAAANEMIFFKGAIEGKYNEQEIRNHYNQPKFKNFDNEREKEREYIKKILYAGNRSRFYSDAISVLTDVLKSDILVVGYLVDQPEASIDIKNRIAESSDEYAVLPMAKNPNTPPEVLRKLAAHSDLLVSKRASQNKNAPPSAKYMYAIHFFYQYPDHFGLPNAPKLGAYSDDELTAWKTLYRDNRASVRCWVASNKMAPVRILEEMARDDAVSVLNWLILNNRTPRSVKQKIANSRGNTLEEVISCLAKSQDQRIRFGVAQSDLASPEILAELSTDSDSMVWLALADNPNTPVETLKFLSTRFDSDVKETATKALGKRQHRPDMK